MSTQSIYDAILENLTGEGKLSPDFMLPSAAGNPSELRFMPGAKDGIGISFFGTRYPRLAVRKIVRLLRKDLKTGSPDSMGKITTILHKHGVVAIMDPILASLQKDSEGFDDRALSDYASRLAFHSGDEEVVKFGIGLLGLTDLSQAEETVERLLKLALYEEFTRFVIVAVSRCADGNDLVFEIAQKVEGWGKISAVERLEPESEEIRGWILREGCANAVLDTYLGLECAVKGDLIGALRREDLAHDLFDSIGIIMEAMLDEGPVDGISVYAHAEESLRRYLELAAKRARTVRHLWYIVNVKDWLEHHERHDKEELLEMCANIVSRSSWLEAIHVVLDHPDDEQLFYAINAASRLGHDIADPLFKAITQDPVRLGGYLNLVFGIPEYARQLTEIYEGVLPLEAMATGMGDFLFAEDHPEAHMCLDFLLQELVHYPMSGHRLVGTALQSPVVRERYGACRTLEGWGLSLGQPLRTFSPELHRLLTDTASKEIDPNLKKRMKRLLKG